jgi:hypothetical protein
MISLPLIAFAALFQTGDLALTMRADSTVVLAPGDTVRVFSSFVQDGGIGRIGGRRLDVIYATRIPAADTESRAAQADRAAQIFGSHAVEIGAKRVSIGICDTQACAQRKHPPAAWFLYERTAQGWRRVK